MAIHLHWEANNSSWLSVSTCKHGLIFYDVRAIAACLPFIFQDISYTNRHYPNCGNSFFFAFSGQILLSSIWFQAYKHNVFIFLDWHENHCLHTANVFGLICVNFQEVCKAISVSLLQDQSSHIIQNSLNLISFNIMQFWDIYYYIKAQWYESKIISPNLLPKSMF